MLFDIFRKRRTRAPADPSRIRSRTQLLNHLVAQHGYRRYLEIGVRNPKDNFNYVEAPEKEGVDPAARCTHRMTSDDFFRQLDAVADRIPYDLIFIDGLHLADQVERDVENSLRHLSDGGAIVLHDVNPPTENAQIEEYVPGAPWNGTVWKAWAKLRGTRSDLFMCVVDLDEGCGVIRRGKQSCYLPWPLPAGETLSYQYLVAHLKALLNLVPLTEFLRLDEPFRPSSVRSVQATTRAGTA
ncbi:MAG TPA: class I SAM-dependent methyltransferase [Polyangia bacterium]|jgi:hypothetical protein|nr:class I SAM-dependent methyltransferase [Polyangia bacterium]